MGHILEPCWPSWTFQKAISKIFEELYTLNSKLKLSTPKYFIGTILIIK